MQQSLFSQKKISSPAEQDDRSGDRVAALRRDLNGAQYQAVTSLSGPILVVAGAGSGKTRTLVYRVAYLIEKGVSPENILLLTFTRKAAQEMLARASLLLDDSCRQVTGGTFHAVANLLLRRYGRLLGYAANFTIIDRSDAEGIINILKSSLDMSGAGKRFPSKRIILNIISKAINKSVPTDDLIAEEYSHLAEFMNEIVTLEEYYQNFKFEHGLMDYDDLLLNWRRLLNEAPEVRQEISDRFSFVMVDEYQDTNPIQAEIVRLLTSSHANVMVVGDDAQSIYSFRGADFKNIMTFPDIFPGTRIIKLEENYRTTQPILDLTNAVIAQATEKYSKNLNTRNKEGEKPQVFSARDAAEEANFIAEKIMVLREQGLALHEMAVLFRSGFHSFKLEIELGSRRIPYEKRGGLKLTESAHVKDLLSYFRVLVNPNDNLSWNRILLMLDKIGPKTAQKILTHIKAAEDPLATLKEYPAAKSWQEGLNALVGSLFALRDSGLSPADQYERLLEYYRPIFERIYYDDYPKRTRDLEQLKTVIAEYDDLSSFVADTVLEPPESLYNEFEPDRLVLSTIHSAKGLEWDTVFIINLVEGKFPVAHALPGDQLEEERRLFYVAATRAKRHLYLTYPREEITPERKYSRTVLSPFLSEVPVGLYDSIGKGLQWYSSRPDFSTRAGISTLPHQSAHREKKVINAALFKVGVSVKHPFFGLGKIEAVTGPRRVDVFFPGHGKKTLHLDFAKLELTD